MKISEVDANVIEAIEGAKRRLVQATGRAEDEVCVALEDSYWAQNMWSVVVFYDGSKHLIRRGDDLEKVVEDVLAQLRSINAAHDEKKDLALKKLHAMAAQMGLTIKEVA